jgi:hypothetical protein
MYTMCSNVQTFCILPTKYVYVMYVCEQKVILVRVLLPTNALFIRHTGYTRRNGAGSKVNKKFISHLTRVQRTPSAAATVRVSHALPAVHFSCLGPVYTRPVGRQGKWTSYLLQVNCPAWTLTWLNFEARQVAWQAARQGKWIEGSSIFEGTCLSPPIPAGNLPFTCLVWTATVLLNE